MRHNLITHGLAFSQTLPPFLLIGCGGFRQAQTVGQFLIGSTRAQVASSLLVLVLNARHDGRRAELELLCHPKLVPATLHYANFSEVRCWLLQLALINTVTIRNANTITIFMHF